MFVLYCLQSDFYLCFECATLPDKVIYKHDEHPLILCCGEQEEEEEEDVKKKVSIGVKPAKVN